MLRPLRAARNLLDEATRAARLCADGASFLRLGTDLLRYRLRHALGRPFHGAERSVRLRGGVTLFYRFNAGDIWSVREVWLFECYRLPFEIRPEVVVDLGANIGLTSVWLAKRFGCRKVVAVEPSAANAALARKNLSANGVPSEVVEAAVGPEDGATSFDEFAESHRGRVGRGGREVAVVSMPTLLRRLEGDAIDLVKIDIEGSEQALLDGDLAWLGRVRAIIAEFHPTLVDYPGCIARLEGQGFRYIRKDSVFPDNMDAFLRPADIGTPSRARRAADSR